MAEGEILNDGYPPGPYVQRTATERQIDWLRAQLVDQPHLTVEYVRMAAGLFAERLLADLRSAPR